MAALHLRFSLLVAFVGTTAGASPVRIPSAEGDVLINLTPWGMNGIAVQISPPGGEISDPIISALLPNPPNTTGVPQFQGPSTLTQGNLMIVIDANGMLTATRVDDKKVLLKQTDLSFGTSTNFSAPGSVSATLTFKRNDEFIYGLGEHKNQKIEQTQRGGYKKLFADSLFYRASQGGDVSIPWYMSSTGYGFVWNLPSLGSVEIDDDMIQWVSNATKCVNLWITTTTKTPTQDESAFPELLNNYVDVAGHATPMPFWTTGFIQCKDRYRNQSQVMDVARSYVERGLPISMIVIDWFHWKEMGDMGLNPECWPDPQAMVDELRSLGIELMVTFWPFMGMPYNNGTIVSRHWEEFNSKGFLANSTATGKPESIWQHTPTGNALIDATNPDTMATVTKYWYQGYGQYGIKAIWMDESEPDHTNYISGGQWMLHAGSDGEVLPAWVHGWSKGFADKFKEIGNGDDFFVLSRNAWSGTWANGAALWSGDIGSHWEDLETAVQAGQSAAVSGIPLWTTDIGGYTGGDPDTPYFQELIVRWFQFGAFCPLFRLHGHRGGASAPPANQCGPTNGDNEVWNLAKDPEHYKAIQTVMMLREQLRDYVIRINLEAVSTGMPMMRPMFFEYPTDPICKNNFAESQFMLGPDWLISPVTMSNATSWPAYLPALKGHEWVYWWDQTVTASPGWVNIDTTSLSDFPLFFRRPIDNVSESV